MQGLGNDFVVLDNLTGSLQFDAVTARRLADRKLGIGCDQILVLEAPKNTGTDLTMRIWNADGAEVEHCGNGARCVARFAKDAGLVETDTVSIGLAKGVVTARLRSGGSVSINMGEPCFVPSEIPFIAANQALSYTLSVASGAGDVGAEDVSEIEIGAVSMGNPHAVIEVSDVADADLATLGAAVQMHTAFPEGVNVGLVALRGRRCVDLRVYERGVGETLACGTGACAAVAVLRSRAVVDNDVAVHLPGGRLDISWAGPGQVLWMTGPASYVFEGEIAL